jgi:CelD/BcsL family acetyltransferase involved in cellulose biosynthesis
VTARLLHVEAVSDPESAWHDIDSFNQAHPGMNPFVRRAWLQTWLTHFRPTKGRAEFLFIRDGEGPVVAYLPCWVTQMPLAPAVYRFMGEARANSLDLPSVAPMDEVLETLAHHFQRMSRGVILRLYDVDERSALAAALARIKGVARIQLYPCPRAELWDGWEPYAQGRLSSKRRSEMRRLERRLSALGPVDVVLIRDATSLARHERLVHELFELHRLRFERILNTSGFSNPRMRPFYEELIARTAQEGTLFLSVMTIGGQAVSFVLSLAEHDRVIDCIPAFDPSLAPFSVGHLHLFRILRELPGAGIHVFDFSKGGSVYKAKWATSTSANLRLAVPYRLSPAGRAWFAALNGRDAAKVYLRRRGVTAWIKRALGTLSYWRDAAGVEAAEPKPVPLDPSGLDVTQPVSLIAAASWSPPVRSAVFRAIAKGASAYVTGQAVALVWPDGRSEAIPLS